MTRPRFTALCGGLLPLAIAGCAPTVDVLGVYFPGWLVSAVVAVVGAYALVIALARVPATRELADSGLFFVSVVAGLSFALWWVLFSGFRGAA
jgi:hypothetical protein